MSLRPSLPHHGPPMKAAVRHRRDPDGGPHPPARPWMSPPSERRMIGARESGAATWLRGGCMNAFLTRGAATALLCLWLPAAATEPVRTREWQPLPAARMALPVLPTPWWVAPGRAPAAAQPQWVQIDPATGAIVPATIPIPLRPEMLGAPLQPM